MPGQKGNVFKRGNAWYVSFSVKGRKTRRSAGRSHDAAKQLLAKLRADAEREALGLPKRNGATPTLKDFAPRYLEHAKVHKRSWKRDQWCLKQLVEAFGNVRLARFDRATVEKWSIGRLQDRAQGRKTTVTPGTINRQLALLKRVMTFAVEQGELSESPLKGLHLLPEPPARSPNISDDELARVLSHLPEWCELLARVALGTAARLGDLIALQWRDVDLKRGVLTLLDRKTQKPRRVPLAPDLIERLRPLQGLPDAPVFVVSHSPRKASPPRIDSVSQAWGGTPSQKGVENSGNNLNLMSMIAAAQKCPI